MEKKPHKHADVIKAWADGAEIQTRDIGGTWVECNDPRWFEVSEYRTKPEPTKYPPTRMTHKELIIERGQVGYEREEIEPHSLQAIALERVANAAIARAIQDGDVIPSLRWFAKQNNPAQ